MTAQQTPGTGESHDTLLLYCPYDRKVTGHARRGRDGTIVCVECGRKLEVAHTPRPPVEPLTPATSYGGPRSMRARRAAIWRRRSQTPWVPLFLVGLVTVVAVFALIGSFGNPFASADRGDSALPTPPQQAAAPPVSGTEAAPVPESPLIGATITDVRVANTGGTGAYLRRTPNLDDRLRAWLDGTTLKVIGPDESQNGVLWKHVQDPSGNQGWIPVQFTVPAG